MSKTSLKKLLGNLNSVGQLQSAINELNLQDNIIKVTPMPGSSKSLIINSLYENFESKLILLPSIQEVNETKVELDILGMGKSTVAVENLSLDIIQERLTDISNRKNFILLAPYDILKVKLPAKDQIDKSTTRLEVGADITYDDLIEYLNMLNYTNEKYVDVPGDYAIRGSIIDFWSFSEKHPCRLEFDGDFIESIRHFDHESQRSSDRIEFVTLAAPINTEEQADSVYIFDYLSNPIVFASMNELTHIFEPEKKKIKVAEDIDDLDDELKKEIYENVNKDEIETVEVIENKEETGVYKLSFEELFRFEAKWIIEEELSSDDGRLEMGLFDPPVINSNFELLFNTLKEYADKSFKIIITAENELQNKRLFDLLSDFKTELKELLESNKVKIETLAIQNGFLAKKEKILVLSDYQIFNKPYRTKISSKRKIKKTRVKEFASMKRGDYVVHENFGIGKYAGLETIKIGLTEQESIKILYAEGGVVYVNLNYLSLVKKFSSEDNAPPKLSTLGSGEWKKTKKKVKSKIKEAARELITLYAKRKSALGIAYSPDSIWQKELEASFFYEDTPDQSKVTDEIKEDMESENPMDRLVCGDVGFGKTEIAVRAAFKAVNDGKQVGLLVPTTILAEQHFNTFKDRLSQFPVKVAVLSRFSTKTKQNEVLVELHKGKVDILIGTHRLLSKDIVFKDLGLLIIDEEHRFGVMAKEKLRSIKINVDTLTLTATPIPRTLNLSLLGARDLSILATPPPNRQPIYTKVEQFEIAKVREWVLDEIKRDGQIYFVHDRVQSIDKIATYLKRHIPELNICIAHGQMKPAQLERVIYDFMNKKYHMLIATKIIESGIDIPNVNTIIINRADRFGLAELHQLRGRVGRSNRKAYAYFLVPSMKTITKKAVKRLQAIEEYTDLGEGFSLSMRDLEIRGAGNLLGTEQHGAIDTVGFDLYVKLLDEAVEELKTEEFADVFKDLPKQLDRTEPTIDTYFEIGIPKNFMPEQADRLSYYTALFSVARIEEIEEVKEEMLDKFGKLPEMVERLILCARLRYHASLAMFERVVIQKEKIAFIFPKAEKEEFYQNKFSVLLQWVVDNYPKKIQFKQGKDSMKLEMTNYFDKVEPMLDYIKDFCRHVEKVIYK